MKNENTMTQFKLDSTKPPTTNWSRFDAMTEHDRHLAALSDPDCQPATEEQLARAQRAPDIRAIRRKLNLTQEQFARSFGLALGSVRDWEQGSHKPDHAARALLKVIAFNPEIVQQALQSR